MEEYWLGHRERLRLKAEKEAEQPLRPHEMIELILCYAVPRSDMSEIARALINRFGDVKGVFAASGDELTSVPGVGKVIADWIMLTGELLKAYAEARRADHFQINKFRDVIEYILPRRLDVRPPECWMMYSDFDNRLMMHKVHCDSLSWAEPEYVRQTISDALALQARQAFLVLFTGNIDLGFDEYEQKHLLHFSRTLRGINVDLMDCVIVSESGIRSLFSEGKMDDIRRETKNIALHEAYGRNSGFID